MNNRTLALALTLTFTLAISAFGQTDLFWSFSPLNSGATNSFAEQTFSVGDTGTLYLYNSIEVDTGCGLDIATTESGVIGFTGAETFCFDVVLTTAPDIALGERWGDIFGPAYMVSPDLVLGLNAGTVVGGDGMIFDNNGMGAFFDVGYDMDAEAFLLGEVTFEALEPGETEILLTIGSTGIVHNGMALSPSIGGARIIVEGDLLLGDLNGDGVVTLLDVAIFVDLLATSTFQLEADINQDGAVNLLDVQPFIDAINFP